MTPGKISGSARDLTGERALDNDLLRLSEQPRLASLANAALPERIRQMAILLGRALDLRRDDLRPRARPDPAP